ncbi:TetR/AcrR family transcriptional regulator [Phytohabitans houttuyneae]|uniref:TetR family transcriptional regulator n=1 Tax=Phytohabitans houttuyneae TaxID=1076126 RepID=A0A6V8K0S2_9ACTN|nr:TetR/AcrR family transcriptional regulator [Phytohabitans houttuyneae]GFJ78713.1 TetR family transcriptional regulator [Phytohabitans houttuyneae]
MSEGTGDTRSRIQAVALELFTEEGYEKTSLREIAERLGVTKAALYYHFKSKDEIANSFIEDRIGIMDRLIEWAESQPPTVETRRTLLERYADELFGRDKHPVMRFFEQNQTAMKNFSAGQELRARMMRLVDLLVRPATSHEAQVRAALSLFSVHSAWFTARDPEITSDQRRATALKIAYELLDKISTEPPTPA